MPHDLVEEMVLVQMECGVEDHHFVKVVIN